MITPNFEMHSMFKFHPFLPVKRRTTLLRRLGKVLHLSPSGNAIVKVENVPKIGENVVDEKIKHIGDVGDVFGPVSSPYVSVKIRPYAPRKLKGKIVYISSHRRLKVKKRSRKHA
jgi:rRNA processing protein Gar1